MVNKVKFSIVMSGGVFLLLGLVSRLASRRHNLHAKPRGLCKTGVLPLASGWKKVLSV